MKLVSMEMSDEERKEESGEVVPHNENKYPWGLTLNLNDEVIEKLGFSGLPKVGSKLYIEGECCVTGVSAREVAGSESEASVTLQIEKLACEGEGDDPVGKIYDHKEE